MNTRIVVAWLQIQNVTKHINKAYILINTMFLIDKFIKYILILALNTTLQKNH